MHAATAAIEQGGDPARDRPRGRKEEEAVAFEHIREYAAWLVKREKRDKQKEEFLSQTASEPRPRGRPKGTVGIARKIADETGLSDDTVRRARLWKKRQEEEATADDPFDIPKELHRRAENIVQTSNKKPGRPKTGDFARDTAEKTGRSKRAINQDLVRGRAIPDEIVTMISGQRKAPTLCRGLSLAAQLALRRVLQPPPLRRLAGNLLV